MARTPSVPAKLEGHAAPAQALVQMGLAERTWDKLQTILDNIEIGQELHPDIKAQVHLCLEGAFREANCNATLFDVSFWDLAGNSRVSGTNAEGDSIVIPCLELPKIGTIIQWAGQTYYIGSHKVVS